MQRHNILELPEEFVLDKEQRNTKQNLNCQQCQDLFSISKNSPMCLGRCTSWGVTEAVCSHICQLLSTNKLPDPCLTLRLCVREQGSLRDPQKIQGAVPL